MNSEDLGGFSGTVPPALLLAETGPRTEVAIPIASFVREALLRQDSPLYNPAHEHLGSATIGYLFTNVEYIKKDRLVLGQAELVSRSSSWARARMNQQIEEWFPGEPLDFLITFYAPYVVGASAVGQMALLEHELYHCAQRLNEYECPMFTKDGRPLFHIRDHDVQEFIGVVRRYGAIGKVKELVEAASTPEISNLDVSTVCGTCLR